MSCLLVHPKATSQSQHVELLKNQSDVPKPFGFLGKAFIWQAENVWELGLHRIRGHQSLFHGDLKACVQDISVDLDINYTLKPRALGCNTSIVSLDFWQAFV